MTKPKHTIDPGLQPMLFAPNAASVAVGDVVQVEGGGFMPLAEAVRLSPDQETSIDRFSAEVQALNQLAAENSKRYFVTKRSNQLRDLQNDYHQDEHQKHPLMDRYNKEIEEAEASIVGHRLSSKFQFAKSIGIEPHTIYKVAERNGEPLIDPDTDEPIKTTVVEAVDEEERKKLDLAYREFRGKYFGSKQHDKLEARRQELGSNIAAIHAMAASAVLSGEVA